MCLYFSCTAIFVFPNTIDVTEKTVKPSLLEFHIYCFKPPSDIRQFCLIQKAIVTDQNFTLSPVLSLYTFSWNSKLSQNPTRWEFDLWLLIHDIIDIVISLSFFCKTSYKTKRLKWFKRVISSTWAPAEYKYKAISRGM